jgi:hypothetical protein
MSIDTSMQSRQPGAEISALPILAISGVECAELEFTTQLFFDCQSDTHSLLDHEIAAGACRERECTLSSIGRWLVLRTMKLRIRIKLRASSGGSASQSALWKPHTQESGFWTVMDTPGNTGLS